MPAAETARLIASLELKDLFSKQITGAEKSLGSFDRKLDSTQGRAYKAGQQIGTGIKRTAALAVGAIGFLAVQVEQGVSSLTKLDDVVTQTNAVLKSTKGAAGENAAAIRDLADKYESLNATIDDTVIQSGENLLLTFTNIRKQAFEPTLKAALDMNQALGGGEAGLQGTIQRLGKALNDPVKGLTALQRVGVTFTAQQKEQIAAAVKAGDTYKAQGIILAELDKRFGGSFLAGGATTTGKIAKFKDAIDDLQRTLATALLPVIGKVADGLSKFLADPAVIRGAKDLGDAIAGLFSDQNLAAGADFLKGAFETAKDAAPIVAGAAKTTFGFVQAAVGLFKSLPPQLQGLLVGGFALNKITGGLVTNVAGGIIDTVGKQFLQRGGTPANPLFVSDVSGGLGGAPGVPATPGGGIGAAGKVFLAAESIAAIGAVIATQQSVSAQNSAIAGGVAGSVQSQISGGASLDDLEKSLRAVDQGIADINNVPFNVLVSGDALNTLKAQDTALRQQLAILQRGYPVMTGTEKNTGKAIDDLSVVKGHGAAQIKAIQAAAAADRSKAVQQLSKLQQIKDADNSINTGTHRVAARIDAAKAAATAAANRINAAAHATTQAIKDKDLSVSVTVPITTQVSIRDLNNVSVRANSFGRIAVKA